MAESDYYDTPKPAEDHTKPGWSYQTQSYGPNSDSSPGWNYSPAVAMAAQQAADADYLAKYRDTTITAKNGPMAGQEIRPIFTEGARYGGKESGDDSLAAKKISGYGFMPNGEHNYFYDTAGNFLFDDGNTTARFNRGMATGLGLFLGAGALNAGGFLGGAASSGAALTPEALAASNLAVYPTSGIVGAVPATAATGLGGLTAAEIYALTPSQLAAYAPAGVATAALTPAEILASDLSVYPTSGIVGSVPATATTGLGGLTAAEINALTPAQLAQYAPAAAGTAASGLPSLSSAASAIGKGVSALKALAGSGGGGGGGGTGTATAGGGLGYASFPGVSGALALGQMGGSGRMGYDNNLDQLALAPDPYLPFSGGSPLYPVSSQQPPMYAASGGHIQHFDEGGTPKPSINDTDIFKAIANLPTGFEGKMPSLNPAPLRMGQQMGASTPPKILAQLANTLKNRGFTFADGGQPDDHKHPHYDGTPVFRTGGLEGLGGKYVEGKGDGTSDDITAMLANGEYVFSADVVSALGNGSNKAGAQELDRMTKAIRARARSAPPDKLPPDAKSPLEYLKSLKGKKHG